MIAVACSESGALAGQSRASGARPGIRGLLRAVTAAAAIGPLGCAQDSSLAQLSEARRLSAALLIDFQSADAASDRAVMADSDDAARGFVRDAQRATQQMQRDAAALTPILERLGYGAERASLAQFAACSAKHRQLDQSILDLAPANTNVKAQRLSSGEAQAAADALRDALAPVVPDAGAAAYWRVRALAATALSSVREIQALQAPHILEAEDAEMTRIEARMSAAHGAARAALDALAGAVEPAMRARVATATAALDRFARVNAQIVELSRRNTDVRSLALTMGQKRTLSAACESALHALQDALAKRSLGGTR
jgi:hypothetical protein